MIEDTALLHQSLDTGLVLLLRSVAMGPPDGLIFRDSTIQSRLQRLVKKFVMHRFGLCCRLRCARQQGRDGVLHHVQTVEAGAGARAQQLEASAAGVMSVLAGPHLSDAATATAAAILADRAAHHCCTHLQSQVTPHINGCSSIRFLMPIRELRACRSGAGICEIVSGAAAAGGRSQEVGQCFRLISSPTQQNNTGCY